MCYVGVVATLREVACVSPITAEVSDTISARSSSRSARPCIGAISTCLFVASSLPIAAAQFATLAGSGKPGVSDGPALSATFLMPYGVAVGAGGTIYVSDYLGQRIRIVRADGSVRTLAGGGRSIEGGLKVEGGYADGPASSARFDGPAGIAVDVRGRVFVADSNNRCIRLIENGQVRTYAGSPLRGYADGPRETAGFYQPRALAFDAGGTLWIGDGIAGLRKLSPAGVISTAHLPELPIRYGPPFATHITAIVPEPNGRLLLADGVSMLDYDPTGAKPEDYGFTLPGISTDQVPDKATPQSASPAGYPFGVAALGPNAFVYTDPRSHAIRLRRPGLFVALSRAPAEGDDVFGGGYADGHDGLVDAPLGIAALGADRVVFADAGNRRVRTIGAIDARTFADEIAAPFGAASDPKTHYRLLFVSNSYGAFRLPFGKTAAGTMERELNARRASLGLSRPVSLAIVWMATTAASRSYIENIVSAGIADAVVWEVNLPLLNSGIRDNYAPASGLNAAQRAALTSDVAGVRSGLEAAHIPLYVASVPCPFDFPAIEDTWTRVGFTNLYPGTDESSYRGDEEFMASLFGAAPARGRFLDLWPAFTAAEAAQFRKPLFTTDDFHLSQYGQELVGRELTRLLERDPPWRLAR